MTEFTITTPSTSDVSDIWRLGHKASELLVSKRGEWHSKKDLSQWISNPGKDILLVAKENNTLIGFCFTTVLVGWAMCNDLYVTSSYRRQGVGKKLMEETIDKLKKKGIGYLGLIVNTDNLRGLKFYEKNGFVKGFTFRWMSRRFRPKR